MIRLGYRFRLTELLSGIIVISLILLFYGTSLWQLFQYGQESHWQSLLSDRYFWSILRFSIYQATLSAILSTGIGLLVAHALFYIRFKGQHWLLSLFSLTFVLPALVVIFGLMGVFGLSGWINQLFSYLGISWQLNLYGLTGILLAHIFFNIPLASKLFLQVLQNIPSSQRKLAAQLNIRGWQLIRLLEWPYLKQQLLPLFALIFMLCFTSFTIVLVLGGGPRYTTLEVAIFQAITFDFDLNKAAILALIQFIVCLILFQSSQLLAPKIKHANNTEIPWIAPLSPWIVHLQRLIILLVIIFLSMPLLNIIYHGFQIERFSQIIQTSIFQRAFLYSLIIAPSAAFCSLVFSCCLLLTARQLKWRFYHKSADNIINLGMIVLAVPTIVLAVGLFLTLRQIQFNHWHLFAIVVLCNALAAMPFVLRILSLPFLRNMDQYENLCLSLGIRGWQRWRLIEWHHLRKPMRTAYAYACAMSLGDFTAIALFGNQSFTSLPHLLYQQLGHYRSQDAAVTALILLLLCAMIFLFIEKNNDKTRTTLL